MTNEDKLTAHGKAGLAPYLLAIRAEMTTAELKRALGLESSSGIHYLMDNLSFAGVPVYQPGHGLWAIDNTELMSALRRHFDEQRNWRQGNDSLREVPEPDELAERRFREAGIWLD